MTAEQFIRSNPFPKNGAEINKQLVTLIQDPSKAHQKDANLIKLLKNNARLIYIIYKQYNYNQKLDSIMSYVYQGLRKACDTFDPKVGMPFYNYAIQQTRGLLQNDYNYTNDVVHVPVMKRKKVELTYAEVDDYIEHQYCLDTSFEEESEGSMLDSAITEYEHSIMGDEELLSELKILKYSRIMTLSDVSVKVGMGITKVRKVIQRTSERIGIFYKQFNEEIENGEVKDGE